ncbi:metallo-beta-lactamase family protein [mine drainage metagenome]|uniref:Metallo-beta-lactamase family protein n=2 Tax=mine drainage metagenome TaxID=410659 RepID=T0YLS6_9ZZZZ
MIIDAGGDFDSIMETAESMPGNPVGVLSTHGHFDHTLVADLVASELRTSFGMHKKDLPVMRDTWSLGKQLGIVGKPSRPGFLIDTDRTTLIGRSEIHIKNTPGHTPGSISIIAGSSIFTGDCIFRGNIGRMDLGGNPTDMLKSLNWFLQLPPEMIIYPGHGEPSTIGNERSNILHFIDMISKGRI